MCICPLDPFAFQFLYFIWICGREVMCFKRIFVEVYQFPLIVSVGPYQFPVAFYDSA